MLEQRHSADCLPVELELDKYHPSNSEFAKNVRRVEQMIVTQSEACAPKHVHVAKAKFIGMKNVDIAKKHRLTPNTVSTILKRPEVRRLTQFLLHLQGLNEAPSLALRYRVLNEIMVDNQASDPRTSLSAIAELNKMTHVYQEKTEQNINIQINNDQFPRGALDG